MKLQIKVNSQRLSFLLCIFMKTNYMKKFFLIVVTAIFSFTVFSQTWIRPEEATKHKGDTVNLIGFVTNIKYATYKKDSSMFISLMTKNSKQSLTLLVCRSDRVKFAEAPEITYLNQYVQVNGLVEIYKGKPQIILHSKK